MRFGYVWFSELIDKNWKVLNSVKLCEIPWNLMKFVRICNEIWKNRVTLVWFLKRAYEKMGGYGRGPPRGLKKIWTSSNWKRQRFLSQSDNLEIKLGWADLWCCGVRWFEQNWKIMHFERNKMKNVEKSTTWRDIFMGTEFLSIYSIEISEGKHKKKQKHRKQKKLPDRIPPKGANFDQNK